MTKRVAASTASGPIRCAIYLRISQDRQNDELGVRRQEKACREMIERMGWQLFDVYQDNDTSAFKFRPGYQRLCSDVEAGDVQAIAAFAPDRLNRNFAELVPLCDMLQAHKVLVQTIASGKYDLSTAGGRAQARLLGVVAALESEIKAERQLAKMAELAEAGKFHGGHRPFGFEADGVTMRENECQLIESWADGILAGKGLEQLAREANAAGFLSARGRPILYTGVRQTLIGPRVAGLRQHQGKVIGEAVWPAIISEEKWEQVKNVLTDPERKHRQYVKFLLTGFLFNQAGQPLRGGRVHLDKRRIYDAPGVKINAELVEQAVIAAVLKTTDERVIPLDRRRPESFDTRALDAVQAEIETLYGAREDGTADLKDFLRLLKPLRDEEHELQQQQASMARTPRPTVVSWLRTKGALRKAWEADKLTFDQQREAIGQVLVKITVKPVAAKRQGQTGRNRFDERRLVPDWRY